MLDGEPYSAKLVGNRLEWDDSDTWIRDTNELGLSSGRPHGLFLCNDGAEVAIDGAEKKAEAQRTAQEEDKRIPEEARGEALPPQQMQACKLDGQWISSGEICYIAGELVTWPNGARVPIAQRGNKASMTVDGICHTATLVKGCLQWDDGDVWNRAEVAAEEQSLHKAVDDKCAGKSPRKDLTESFTTSRWGAMCLRVCSPGPAKVPRSPSQARECNELANGFVSAAAHRDVETTAVIPTPRQEVALQSSTTERETNSQKTEVEKSAALRSAASRYNCPEPVGAPLAASQYGGNPGTPTAEQLHPDGRGPDFLNEREGGRFSAMQRLREELMDARQELARLEDCQATRATALRQLDGKLEVMYMQALTDGVVDACDAEDGPALTNAWSQ
jgi:hypothetical protein